MTAYMAARLKVNNPDKLAEYSKAAAPIIAKFGGNLLFKGGAGDNLVGELDLPNLAVFAFPSKEAIQDFYDSAEYQALSDLRQEGAEMVLSAHEEV